MEKFGMESERRVHWTISTQKKDRAAAQHDIERISSTRIEQERL